MLLALPGGYDISAEKFTSLVLDAANECIPRTSTASRRTPVPWWSEECKKALRARKRAFKSFDRNSTTENLIAYRKANAHVRRTLKDAKRDCWLKYVAQLNRFSSLSDVWARIHRISGRSNSAPLPLLRVGNRNVSHPADVANEIASALSQRSRGGSVDPIFLRHRDHSERTTIDFTTSEPLPYNTRFTMAELTAVISSLRDVAEGPDCLHNNMIKHLPEVALQVLLSILNPRPAGGGGAFERPPLRFFEDSEKNGGAQRRRVFTHLTPHLFRNFCENFSPRPCEVRSPGQVK